MESGREEGGVGDGFELESRCQKIPITTTNLRLCVRIYILIDDDYIDLGARHRAKLNDEAISLSR